MSKLEQLTASYKAKELYWDELQSMVKRVRTDFSAYLGVPDTMHIPVGRHDLPVVTTGKVDERGIFIPFPDDELPTDNESILFSLRLAYGATTSAARSDVKPFIVFDLAIKGTANGYPVTIMQEDEKKEINGPIYSLLFDELFSRTIASLK